MNGLRILFKTNRFNLSKVGEHFINLCCFGEDLASEAVYEPLWRQI
jgi:hypothetical protein